MGDNIEAILLDDPRYDPRTNKSFVIAQCQDTIKAMERVAKRLKVILQGNHEYKLYTFGDITEEWLISSLRNQGSDVQYGTYSCVVVVHSIKDNKIMYKMFLTHGHRQITSAADDPQRVIANMKLILKRHLKNKMGDCVIMAKGHSHKLLIADPVPTLALSSIGGKIKEQYITSDNNERYIHPDSRWYCNCGSFLRLYGQDVSGYAERFEYDPIELGYIVVKVQDRQIASVEKKVI
jgi:hypothetical protein